MKFVENEKVEDYFQTTHLKLFQNFTGSLSKKTFVINTSRQNLPTWFDNDDLSVPSDPKSFRDFRASVLQKIRFLFTTSILVKVKK